MPEGEMGRPTIYTKDLANLICERLALGQSLRTVCKETNMPAMSTVFRWMFDEDKKDFREHYEEAKVQATEALAEEILDISDESSTIIRGDDKSDGARVQANRLRVDTRKWIMAKMKPKKYGDKIDMTTNGKDLPTPILGIVPPKADE